MSRKVLYGKDGYLAIYKSGNQTITNSTRPVLIDWKKNINDIIKMSTAVKGTTLDFTNIIDNSRQQFDTTNSIEPLPDTELKTLEENTVLTYGRENSILVKSFWSIISRISWYERDERQLTTRDLTRVFSSREMEFLLDIINRIFIPELKASLGGVCLHYIDEEKQNNILTHIIMKGQLFYTNIIEFPEVSLYLCDQYYPVYDWLRSCFALTIE